MNVLVTGGCGYIGSHGALRLLRDGHAVTILDDLSRGHGEVIDRLRSAPGVRGEQLAFNRGDIGNQGAVETLLRSRQIEAVVHFAALTYAGESVEQPLVYYDVNFARSLSLLRACEAAGIERFVFSSTAATYGEPAPERVPIREDLEQRPINPYGASKLMFERALHDYSVQAARANRAFSYVALRYFNVVGCEPSGLLGEDHDPETHLVPIILQCLLGRRPKQNNVLQVFGTDYPTADGTCIRDYVHVEDLIDAHAKALAALAPGDRRIYNVATGRGQSIRQVIDAVERVTGLRVATAQSPRRPGDPAVLCADPSKIERELGWKPREQSLESAIAGAWAWMQAHPRGYSG